MFFFTINAIDAMTLAAYLFIKLGLFWKIMHAGDWGKYVESCSHQKTFDITLLRLLPWTPICHLLCFSFDFVICSLWFSLFHPSLPSSTSCVLSSLVNSLYYYYCLTSPLHYCKMSSCPLVKSMLRKFWMRACNCL